ncbi:MAG: T9SS type A sorting domain-containing protein [Bacteroidota bacterium]
MISKLFTLTLLISLFLTAQERVLLHINKNGQQEAIPLKKGERVRDVIESIENNKPCQCEGSIHDMSWTDTLRYYTGVNSLSTNFSFSHQDVALQYFIPTAPGVVREFWWRNYTTIGNLHKATIRAWNVDSKVTGISLTKPMGRYKDPTDGDGLKTPYKPVIGDQWFYKTGDPADTAKYGFDPLGIEAKWLPGGLQVSLYSDVWQGIKLPEWGDSMITVPFVPFGFSLQNDTKLTDLAGATDTGMNVLSYPTPAGPYHSFKFYETQRLTSGDGGWWMRQEYEWGMYVVVDYQTTHTKVVANTYGTTLKSGARKICVTVSDDNPGGNDPSLTAFLFFRFGSMAQYDSVQMLNSGGSLYCANVPAAHTGDTVYWYCSVTDRNGNRTKTTSVNYRIFQKKHPRLFLYNNAQYPIGNTGANFIYNNNSDQYDRWSGPLDGIGELDTLFSLYNDIAIIDGSFPARNVYSALQQWIKTGTPQNKKNLFLSSQDYGCYIQAECADTSFAAGTFERDYLGLTKLGPQDQGPTTRPVKMIPQPDTLTNYLIKYNADSSTTLWHFPTFELAFSGYPDYMQPSGTAKALFKDGTGTNVFGVRNSGSTFNTAFFAFDVGALEFRSDTSLTPANDPKYFWISDYKALTNTFFDAVTGVSENNIESPNSYALLQNFPNPFNPSTTIHYTVGQRTNVQLNVYNVLGQKVAALVNEMKEPGQYTASFNGRTLSSGLYFYEMRAGSFVSVKKMMLLK